MDLAGPQGPKGLEGKGHGRKKKGSRKGKPAPGRAAEKGRAGRNAVVGSPAQIPPGGFPGREKTEWLRRRERTTSWWDPKQETPRRRTTGWA